MVTALVAGKFRMVKALVASKFRSTSHHNVVPLYPAAVASSYRLPSQHIRVLSRAFVCVMSTSKRHTPESLPTGPAYLTFHEPELCCTMPEREMRVNLNMEKEKEKEKGN